MSTPTTPPATTASKTATGAPQASQGPAASPSAKTEQPTPGAPGAVSKEPVRMLKVKVDGKEVELPESEVLELASAGRASTQRFQEAAKMRKEAEELLKFAKANPKEFFQKTGMNAREWAEKYLIEELQAEAMSPEQRKARENEDKLRKYEADEKGRKDQELNEERQRATAVERERLDKLFTSALYESGLPRTPYTVKRMAELQLINIKNKYELNASQLAKLVKEDYVSEQKALLGSLDGDQLIEFMGPENAKKFSKAQIAKLKARGVGGSAGGQRAPVTQNNEGLTWRELQKRNRKPIVK